MMDWDYRITWLGAEPELEPTKSYIIEFISYDMMSSWEAHVLGICQPAIELDTFTVSFTVNSSGMAEADLPVVGPTSEIRAIAVIDGTEFTLDDVYDFNNETQSVVIPMEIERKFMGKTLSEIQMKSTNTPAFQRYYADNLNIILKQNTSNTIDCQPEPKSVDAEFIIHINSDVIETYMRGGLTLEDYNAYPAQVESEKVDPVTFVDELPAEGGQGRYVINNTPTSYWVWYDSLQEWKSSIRIVPTSEFLTQLDVTGRFKFDWGNIAEDTDIIRTYYYAPENSSVQNGVSFDFHAADGVMVDPLVVKAEDNHVTNIKLRYESLTPGLCVSAEDTLTVKTGSVEDPATVYVNAETITEW